MNGIAPFVQPYLQKSIASFFKPSSTAGSTSTRGRKRRLQDSGDVTSDSEEAATENIGRCGRIEDLSKEGPASLRLALQRYRWPHILFLQEIKIQLGDAKTMGAVRQAINDVLVTQDEGQSKMQVDSVPDESMHRLEDGGPEYAVHFNLPADPYNAKGFGGKVYGVAAIMRRDFESKFVQSVRDVKWDREGRIQVVETREIDLPMDPDWRSSAEVAKNARSGGKHGTKFAIINVYAVNGTANPYHSTHTGAEVGTRHDRKLAVHTELLREARALEGRGFQVVIAGDLNIARCELDGYPNLRTRPHQHVLNRNDFNEKFFSNGIVDLTPSKATYGNNSKAENESQIPGFDGIDTFRHVHGTARRYSYHPRGIRWGSSCDRVDLIVASKALSRRIVNAGIYDSPRDRGPSDHCPMWVEIGHTHEEGHQYS